MVLPLNVVGSTQRAGAANETVGYSEQALGRPSFGTAIVRCQQFMVNHSLMALQAVRAISPIGTLG